MRSGIVRSSGPSTIRRRLLVGFGASVGVVAVAAATMSVVLGRAHDELQRRTAEIVTVKDQLSASEAATRQYVALAQADLLRPDAARRARMDLESAAADSLRRALTLGSSFRQEERARLARIAALQARLGTRLAIAGAHRQLGETAGVERQVELAGLLLDSLFTESHAIVQAEDARTAELLAAANERVARQQLVLRSLLALGVLVALACGWVTWRAIVRPLDRLTGAARQLGRGDLRVVVHAEDLDEEFRVLAEAYNETTRRLGGIVEAIQQEAQDLDGAASSLTSASEQAAAATGEVSATVAHVASTADQQLHSFEQTRPILDRVTGVADALDRTAREAHTLRAEVQRLATGASDTVTAAMETLTLAQRVIGGSAADVRRVEEAAARVQHFVDLVERISQQTNLLALNAAIEAARAGSAGRGFAIVADEVRKLADESERAATEVRGVVDGIRAGVGLVATGFRNGVERLGDVGATTRTVTEALASIQQVVAGIDALAGALGTTAGSNRASVVELGEQMTAAAQHAQSQAAASQEASAGAEETAAAAEEVAATASQLSTSADRLGKLVAAFSV
jgi:methyl-accepting chemotaxis protein